MSTGDAPSLARRQATDRWTVLRRHVEDGVSLATLAVDTGVGLRTLQRWHADYKRSGPVGLAPAVRSDRGTRRLHPELVNLIEGLALVKPRRSVATIARDAESVARRHGWTPPSYSSVRSVVGGVDPEAVTLAHDGSVAYRDRFELVWRHRAERPNATWQADHTELDILIRDANAKPARPWLTVVLDDHSRSACGYMCFLGAPSAMNTALALRQAIWPKADPAWPVCGIPDVLYVDHGSDFTSHQLAQVALDLHFEIIYSAVARPQGRGKIERFFETLNTELLARLPGHLVRGQPRPEPVLDLAQLDAAIAEFIVDTYIPREHPEIHTSPRDAWLGDGWLPRLPASVEELDSLLLTVAKARVVHRDGVHFQGLRYISPTLAAYVGEPIVVRYDPRDITEIRVFCKDQFVCKAVDPDHAGATITLKDIQAARSARRREVRSQINERIAVVAEHLPDVAPRPAPVPEKSRPGSRLRTYYEDKQ